MRPLLEQMAVAYAMEIEELRAEIERLRAVLERIAGEAEASVMRGIARGAFGGEAVSEVVFWPGVLDREVAGMVLSKIYAGYGRFDSCASLGGGVASEEDYKLGYRDGIVAGEVDRAAIVEECVQKFEEMAGKFLDEEIVAALRALKDKKP